MYHYYQLLSMLGGGGGGGGGDCIKTINFIHYNTMCYIMVGVVEHRSNGMAMVRC